MHSRNALGSRRPGRDRESVDAGVATVRRFCLRILDLLDLLVYVLVGIAFVSAALLALGFSAGSLLQGLGVKVSLGADISNVLNYVSDLLLVLIIMEVLGTVRSYLARGDTSVKPFLFIGIISATRGILSIGARLSIVGAGTTLSPDEFRNSMIELGINALVIIALGVTIRVLGHAADEREESDVIGAEIPASSAEPPQRSGDGSA